MGYSRVARADGLYPMNAQQDLKDVGLFDSPKRLIARIGWRRVWFGLFLLAGSAFVVHGLFQLAHGRPAPELPGIAILFLAFAAIEIYPRSVRRICFAWSVAWAFESWIRHGGVSLSTALYGVASVFACYAAFQEAIEERYGKEGKPTRVKATALAGLVRDDIGPTFGAVVEERSADWKERLSETRTDDDGRFEVVATAQEALHYLRVTWPGLKPARLIVEIREGAKPLVVWLRPKGRG